MRYALLVRPLLNSGPLGGRVDTDEFPKDENGAALRHMAAHGIDLTSLRVVDFEHVFPDESSARAFAEAVCGQVLEARVREPDPDDDAAGWEVQCRQRLVPTHAEITAWEAKLASSAAQFGGRPDGWGTLSEPDGSPSE